jgi:hypothetical protein
MSTVTQAEWAVPERIWAGLVTTGVVGAALWPLVQYRRPAEKRVDGFPLSYYPMFSPKREQYGTVSYAVGVRADGSRERLPYYALGTGGVNQVRRQLSRSIHRNRVDRHAEMLAERISQRPDCADVVRVEIVQTRFDFDAYMMQGEVGGVDNVLGGADVPGREKPGPSAPTALAEEGAR